MGEGGGWVREEVEGRRNGGRLKECEEEAG